MTPHGKPTRRRVLITSIVLAIAPASLTFLFVMLRSNPDEGADIGGGLLVLAMACLGIVLGVAYLSIWYFRFRLKNSRS